MSSTIDFRPMALWPMPDDMIVRDVIFDSSVRATSLHTETLAVRELSGIVGAKESSLLRFLDVARRVCGAGSAGMSLLGTENVTGLTVLHWHAVAGALAAHKGTATRRDFSTCGLCLDDASPMVLDQPERVFGYLRELPPKMREVLVVPLFIRDAEVGTLWVVHHDRESHFCSDDARVLERLALHLMWAWMLLGASGAQPAELDQATRRA